MELLRAFRINPTHPTDSRNRWLVSWSVLFPIILILLWDTIAHIARYDHDFLLSITFGQIDSFSAVLQSRRKFYSVLVANLFRIFAGSVLFILSILVLKCRYKTSFSVIGLTIQNWWTILIVGTSIGFLQSVVVSIPSIEFFPSFNISFGPLGSVWRQPLIMALSLIAAAVTIPVCEELIFRGVFYAWLRKKMGMGLAVAVNTLIFMGLHGVHPRAIVAFVLSIVTCCLYEKTGSLLLCIVIHSTCNLSIIIIRFVLLD